MVIMEPVKGGTLAKLTPDLEAKFKAVRPESSIASWALRFAASQPGVMTVLSGMSTPEQMADNLKTFAHFEPLSDTEKAVVEDVRKIIMSVEQIGCTACRYCTDGCPMNIAIPDVFRAINTMKLYNEDAEPEPVFRDAGKYTVYLFGEGDYRGYEEKNFYIIPPEEKLNRMLKNAEEDVDEAQLRVDLLSDSDSAKEVEAAYRQLVKAQQKLIEAEEMLILSNELL